MPEATTGMIFDIQSYSVHDGPGCRTNVFFVGCPLQCRWCANPESWAVKKHLLFAERTCKWEQGCTACRNACPNGALTFDEKGKPVLDWTICNKCQTIECSEVCAAHALKQCVRFLTVDDLMKILMRDYPNWGSDGGVTFSGGEPLLRRELPALLRSVKELGYAVKLDTNGSHPEALRAVVATGLVDYVAMDIKNSPAKYAATVGLPGFDLTPVRQSAALLLEGTVDYEFRTTAVAELHDDDSFREIAQWIAGAKRYYIQCFIDRDSVLRTGLHAPDKAQLERWADIVRPLIPSVELRGV